MAKLVMCKGLPGSGKSTWAKEQIFLDPSFSTIRVNKDTIRSLSGLAWSRETEKTVIAKRDELITLGLKAGCTVISDDTNFGKKHEPRLRQLAMEACAEFEVKVFDTPLDECLKRNRERHWSERVSEGVITQMAKQYGLDGGAPLQVVAYNNDPTLSSAIICDLDGTLAIHQGRSPYDFEKCDTDEVNEPVRKVLWAMSAQYTEVIYLSGRDDIVYQKTQRWLAENNCPNGNLFMRNTGDKRNDAIVKRELFDLHVAGKYHVEFVLDDRDRVVKMWRELGLCCLQVNYGNF